MPTFDEALTQTVELLQRHGRISYRALRRQFGVDDDFIADLRDELIEIQGIAADENGTTLILRGEANRAPPVCENASSEPEPEPVQSAAETQNVRAERRHLTVMFCDIVDSTALSEHLDPEQLGELYAVWQDACAETIASFGGHIAEYRGDGVFVYFGFPVAYEDGPERAVRAAMAVLETLRSVNEKLRVMQNVALEIRIGIHSGVVLLSDLGGRHGQKEFAFGETPNVAARIQSFAKPNEIAVSGAVQNLTSGLFEFENLGAQPLKGISRPVAVYRVVGESDVAAQFDAPSAHDEDAFLTRRSELSLLVERWELAREGHGQIALLTGEPGIGKSRLARELRTRALSDGGKAVSLFCSPYRMATPLFPAIDSMRRMLHVGLNDDNATKYRALEAAFPPDETSDPDTLKLFASLLSIAPPEGTPALQLTPQDLKVRTFDAYVDWLLRSAEKQPLLVLIEDLQWADRTTIDLANLLIEQIGSSRVFVLMTSRPEFRAEWPVRSNHTQLALSRLTNADAEELLLRALKGKKLSRGLLEQIVERGDGVPLFIEELAATIVESGMLREENGTLVPTAPLATLPIPTTLQDSLMARLDRLSDVRETAQLAAALGREFPYELIRAVAPGDEASLRANLRRIVDSEMLQQRGALPNATFHFRHALIQETAYQSTLKSRRRHFHQLIAQTLEERFADVVNSQPETLAHHYTGGGRPEAAIGYCRKAGDLALRRFANVEALAQYEQGLSLLDRIENGDFKREEFLLHLGRGAALIVLRGQGSNEVREAYRRALEVGSDAADARERFLLLLGLYRSSIARSQFDSAIETAIQLFDLGDQIAEPAYRMCARMALALVRYHMVDFSEALALAREGLDMYEKLDAAQRESAMFLIGQNPGMACAFCVAYIHWLQGDADSSALMQRHASEIGSAIGSPFQVTTALGWSMTLNHLRGDAEAALKDGNALLAMVEEHGFPVWSGAGHVHRGAARVALGQEINEALEEIRDGVQALEDNGVWAFITRGHAVYAEAAIRAGRLEEAADELHKARAAVHLYAERWWKPELARLQAAIEIAGSIPRYAEAERLLRTAIDEADARGIAALGFRASIDLAKLLVSLGRNDEAESVLAPRYAALREGFATRDALDARKVLDSLATFGSEEIHGTA